MTEEERNQFSMALAMRLRPCAAMKFILSWVAIWAGTTRSVPDRLRADVLSCAGHHVRWGYGGDLDCIAAMDLAASGMRRTLRLKTIACDDGIVLSRKPVAYPH